MSSGLPLAETKRFPQPGIELRIEEFWAGRLEEWLAAVLPRGAAERYGDIDSGQPGPDGGPADNETVLEWTRRHRVVVQTWSFPTGELLAEYLQSVSGRSEADVLALLRLFLFEESCLPADAERLRRALYVDKNLPALIQALPVEYGRRLLMWAAGTGKPYPSIRWALDLLPDSPQQAIDVIAAYLSAHALVLSDNRPQGLLDAIAIIRARWIEDLSTSNDELFRLSPRDLELLAAALYRKLGYTVQVTPPSRDGGRDVIAIRQIAGQREVVNIECKTHTSPVGVGYVRQLRGVVERYSVNRGILITIGTFTRGARRECDNDSRLELIDGAALTQMLNANFGPRWADKRALLCRSLT